VLPAQEAGPPAKEPTRSLYPSPLSARRGQKRRVPGQPADGSL